MMLVRNLDDEVFCRKVRALCCRCWGITPYQFDNDLKSGIVSLGDINDAVGCQLVLAHDKLAFIEWLYPGARKAMEEKAKEEAEEKRFENDWGAIWALANSEE